MKTAPKFFFIMDPIATINPKKDSTLVMMEGAQSLGYPVYFLAPEQIFLKEGKVSAHVQSISLHLDKTPWCTIGTTETVTFSKSDIVVQRKDPPFNMHYIHVTYLLELMEKQGALICNRPDSLRDCNEKMFTAWFPELCPETLVSSQYSELKAFVKEKHDVIIKPLDGMGGSAIFRIQEHDPNLNVILETLTEHQKTAVMMQSYIPEITQGDKRIILINGEPLPYLLARIPAEGETRANLATGGTGVVQPLSEHDYEICQRVSPELKKRGLYFVGLDVIGNYLTEINVTSPTGIRQIQEATQIPIGQNFINVLVELWEQR